ncbi:MAG TPA: CHAT domain-containing protein [Pyrinomonadaceae bacterium]|nr:CHAT domain-containing protein [Pyrinomonadaceae bacterium]
MALWSKESPDRVAGEQSLRRTFAENEQIQVRGLSAIEVRVDGGKALARVVVEASAVDAKTGAAAAGFGRMSRVLQLVKEKGGWKVWRYASAEEELAGELVAAGTREERRALLEARGVPLTPTLTREIIMRAAGLYSKGDLAKALDITALAQDIAEQAGDRTGAAAALRLMGNIHTARGDYAPALDYYRKSLALAEESGDKLSIAGSLNNLGNVYDLMGDSARAAEYFQRCLSIASEVKHPQLQTLALNNLGVVYKEQGDSLRALELFQRSLKLAEELKDQPSVSRALFNIGTVHSAQGNYPQALEFYQKSLAIKEKLGNGGDIPRLLGNIGLAHFRQGDYQPALDYHRRALRMAEEMGDKETIAGTLNNIGDVYAEQGNYTEALTQYRQGLTLTEAIGSKWLVAGAWLDLGATYLRLGDYQKALEDAERAAALGQQADLPSPVWQARTVAGRALLALKQPERARRSLEDAVSTVERLRERVAGGEEDRERFFEHKVEPYYAMVDLLLAQGDDFEALAYGDRAKSRVLADVLGSGRINITKAMTAAEQERERALNGQVVALNRQLYREKARPQPDASRLADLDARLRKARLDYEAFQTELYAAHAGLELQRGGAAPLTPEIIGGLLPDGKTALLEFVVGDERSYLFTLTKGPRGEADLKTYRLAVSGKELAARVEEFRGRLAGRDPEFREPARRLYDLLLKPAAGQLRGKSLLCVVPDGILWELPFQALQTAEGHYLIEDQALFYAPSLAVLYGVERSQGQKVEAASAPGGPSLLAFGNPAVGEEVVARVNSLYRGEELGPLPEAEREVKALKEIYKSPRSRVHIGSDARELAAKAEMGHYHVIHFATHGVLDDLNPMYSHLVLSQSGGEEGEDGLLHAWEVMRLDLKADLVVLSACETARGRVGAGEGVVGMSWALFVAGSPTTVASQWSVESSSTTQLMVEFHRNLLTPGGARGTRLRKAEALRRASLKLLKNSRYAHPFYWAGFVMVGDGFRPL